MSCVGVLALLLQSMCPLSHALGDARFASGIVQTERASPP